MRDLKLYFSFLEEWVLKLLLEVDAIHEITANELLDNQWIAEFWRDAISFPCIVPLTFMVCKVAVLPQWNPVGWKILKNAV